MKFLVSFINSWYDPPKAKEAAFAMIDRGADVMYAERFGVSDAAKESSVKVIGNVIDTSAQYPGTVLASALWHMEPTHRPRREGGASTALRGDRLRPLQLHGHGGASLAIDDKLVPAGRGEARQGQGKGDHRRHVPRQHERRRAEVELILRARPHREAGARHAAPVSCSLAGIGKRFGALVANDAIDLELRRGEILALLGENGAGKTTLMNILFGHYVADEGTISVAGPDGALPTAPPGSPHAALDAGIGMVHQHFALAESLTVLENVVLGTGLSASLRLAARRAREKARRADGRQRPRRAARPARRRGFPSASGSGVEILKVLYRGARILVLDEPTAVLTPQEVEGLFVVLRRLVAGGPADHLHLAQAERGLRHRRPRRGAARRPQSRGATRRGDGPARRSPTLMVGREVSRSRREPQAPGATVLMLKIVVDRGEDGRAGLDGVSLDGARRRDRRHRGRLRQRPDGACGASRRHGEAARRPRRCLSASRWRPGSTRRCAPASARIPEDRHHEGVVGALSIAREPRARNPRRCGVRSASASCASTLPAPPGAAIIAAFDMRCPGPDAPIRLLSGGNMQKVILARVPHRASAVGARGPADARASMSARRPKFIAACSSARARGAAIVLISEDLDELLALSDRVAVMTRRPPSAPEPVETLTLEAPRPAAWPGRHGRRAA